MSDRSLQGNVLQEYYVGKIRALNAERTERLNALRTRADAERYIGEIRQKIAACFPMPPTGAVPRTETTGVLRRPGFRIEKIIYYSRPDFPVTASLYLPECPGKAPAVLFLCGHSQQGKAADAYQLAAQGLALQGYAVLAVDPAGQGERYQFLGVENAIGIAGACTREHNMLGKQLQLCGEFFGAWRAYDALRGLDYLLSRPEVDASRVGITGNSGGGTMTSFVQALDSRFTMAAPSCYITSWRRNIENELPADIEQIPPGILASGCEMGDLILCRAPRPVLLLGQKNDFFDPRGLLETYESVQRIYTLLGAGENVKFFIGPTDHGYSIENRRAMYGFFNAHAGINGAVGEPAAATVLPPAELNCTPSGQAANLPGTRGIHDLAVELAAGFAKSRPQLSPDALKAFFRKTLGVPEQVNEPYCRALRHGWYSLSLPTQLLFNRFLLETEPGMLIPLKLMHRNDFFHFPALEKLTLYIPHLDSSEEMPGTPFEGDAAGLDVRGVGETMPSGCDRYEDNFFVPYGRDYHFASCALMFGSTSVAGRVFDILSALVFLKARGVRKIQLAGRGLGTIPAAIAALISPDVCGLTLFDAPESWESMVRARVTIWPESIMIPGVLRTTDLPDVYRAVQSEKPLKIVNFADQLLRPRP